MRIIYMGTPDFAVNTLECLAESRHDVVAVFTQPDKPQGRKQILSAPPVKEKALELGIPVYQPEKLRTLEMVELIKSLEPDIIVVAAYGQILSKDVLDAPKYGCINVHASLLPKYRGASPIQWSILNGDEETGVTIMRMDEGLDTGDIILQEKIRILPEDTADTLFERMANLGGPLALKAIEQIEAGTAIYIKQKEDEASYVKMIKKEMGEIDWSKPAEEISRLVRGLNSWPCAYTFLKDKQLKIWESKVATLSVASAVPGQIVSLEDGLVVACGEGALVLREVQLAGKKRMKAIDFARGYRDLEGTVLGREK